MILKTKEWFSCPGSLDKSVRKLLLLEKWKEDEIAIFMQVFVKLGRGEIRTLNNFCKELLRKNELKSKHKKIRETFFIGRLFTLLVNDFGDIDYIKKFSEKTKKDIRKMNEELFGEFLKNPS